MGSASHDARTPLSREVFQRIDPVCEQFEQYWKASDQPPRIEDFLSRAAAADRAALLRELLLLEVDYLRARGQTPHAQDYADRFVDCRDVIEAVFPQPPTGRADSSDAGSTDSNLLFGVLALQLDFIDRDQLVAAMNAWAIEKNKPLGDILLDRAFCSRAEHSLLCELVALHLKNHANDPIQSLASVNLVESAREELQQIENSELQASLALVSADHRYATQFCNTPAWEPEATATMRFHRLRRHAQGGLGTVYVARDVELHRDVALKEIQPDYADDDASRARFMLEAEVTGRLEHPGVVPVYGLGRNLDGRPYYAMKFIQGTSLEQAIRTFHKDGRRSRDRGEWTLEFRKLLGQLIDVCNAIEYAHSRGVLHRDLKPSNIMLGKYGETLVVDWGLAKVVGRPDRHRDSDEVTLKPDSIRDVAQTGMQAVGTPAYMSPEQAAGDQSKVGPAADVYCLGATLYHLLTGRPPQYGKATEPNAQQETPDKPRDLAKMLRRIQDGELQRPSSVGGKIPSGLEAIALKAMHVDPRCRYASPRELAEEIEHWLADEVVTAHRESLRERCSRWMRRHRAWTQAGGLATLLIAIVATVAAVQIDQQRQAAVAAGERERAQRERADRNFELAQDAVRDGLLQVAGDSRLARNGLETLQRDLLSAAADRYARLIVLEGDDPALLDKRAMSLMQLAEIRQRIGEFDKAESDLLACRRLSERLSDLHPEEKRHAQNAAQALGALGQLYTDTGRVEEGLQAYQGTADRLQSLIDEGPEDGGLYYNLAITRDKLASLYDKTSRVADAEAEYARSIRITQRLVRQHPDDASYRKLHHAVTANLGLHFLQHERFREAMPYLQDALKRFEQDGLTLRVAQAHIGLGDACKALGKFGEAASHYEAAIDIREELVEQRPDDVGFRGGLGVALLNAGHMYARQGDLKRAEETYQKGRDIYKQLASEHPEIPSNQSHLVRLLHGLGNVYKKSSRYQDAAEQYGESIDVSAGLVERFPDVADYQNDLAASHFNIGALYMDTMRLDEAKAAYRRSLAIREGLANRHPDSVLFQERTAWCHQWIGEVCKRMNKLEEALEQFELEAAMRREIANRFPDAHDVALELAMCLLRLGGHYQLMDRLKEAGTPHQDALRVLQKIAEREHDSVLVQSMIAENYFGLAKSKMAHFRIEESFDDFKIAIGVWNTLLEQHGPETKRLKNIVIVYQSLADLYFVNKRWDEAQTAFENALPRVEELLKLNPQDAGSRVFAAASYALAHNARVNRDAQINDEHLQRADRLAQRAVALLKEALKQEKAAATPREVLDNPDFDSLQDRADFKELLDLSASRNTSRRRGRYGATSASELSPFSTDTSSIRL